MFRRRIFFIALNALMKQESRRQDTGMDLETNRGLRVPMQHGGCAGPFLHRDPVAIPQMHPCVQMGHKKKVPK